MTRLVAVVGLAMIASAGAGCEGDSGPDPALRLVGQWQRGSGFDMDTMTFDEFGDWAFHEYRGDAELEDHLTGVYSLSDTRLFTQATQVAGGARVDWEMTYAVNDVYLVLGPHLREGGGDDLVGTWKAYVDVKAYDVGTSWGSESTLVLGESGDMTWTTRSWDIDGERSEEWIGTYVSSGDSVSLRYVDDDQRERTADVQIYAPGAMGGLPPYVREPTSDPF